MSKVRLELTMGGPHSRVFVDDLEITGCRAVQVFASVDNVTVVALELIPQEVTIVGEANVINTLEQPRIVTDEIDEADDLEHNRRVVERAERARRRRAPARPPAGTPQPEVVRPAGVLRCENTLGGMLVCERTRNHEGLCFAVESVESVTGAPMRLVTVGGELRAGTCRRCRASMLVQHLVITPAAAEPFMCRNEVDCALRFDGEWPSGPCCTGWANREDEHAADCPVVAERIMAAPATG